ncbi:redoxin domain-containing protein [Mariniblastus fucicola]|nr:redoxin domain-containing protein [Mariniblastus fucicola]
MPVRQLLLLFLVACFAQPISAEETKHTGEIVKEFVSQDYRGQEFKLSDVKDRKLVVLAFLGTECPLAKLYGGRLQTLADAYGDRGVTVIGINSNRQDNVTEIGAYMQRHSLKFRMLKDVGNKVADQVGAKRTPEVFLLDSERKVRYRGRIDDQYGVGYSRQEPTVSFLQNAIDELLAGSEVSTPTTETVGCHIGRIKTPQEDSEITYCNQVSRILQTHCVRCHRDDEIGPFTLTEYDEVVGWAEMIEEVIDENRMPPWNANPQHGDFSNARYLTDKEKQTISQWVEAGAPQGDEADLPEPDEYVKGWQLPKEPDFVANVSPKPFRVKAEGVLEYEHFRVDPKFTTDKWVKAVQLLPGNHRVVHHILAFAVPKGQRMRDIGGGIDGFLAGYVPGLTVEAFPEGMAKRIPKGSTLLLEVHYTPIGSVQTDHSKIGIVFADEDEITHEVITTSGINEDFRIPPNTASHPVTARSHRPIGGSLLLGMMPHMHLRGKSFRYTAKYPDGEDEVLLDVPNYDFNWQMSYRLTEPKPIPEGTSIQLNATFDNSKNNFHNPNPDQTVRWGDQTYEEMMIGYFDIAVPIDDEIRSYNFPQLIEAQGLMYRFDKNRDGKVVKSELPGAIQKRFGQYDHDEDGAIVVREVARTIAER